MSEWEPVLVEMTAYCPCKVCCGEGAHGVTANGTKVSIVWYNFAGNKEAFPFGSQVFVPTGYGVLDRVRSEDRVFRVDDRGGALETEAKRGIPRLDLRVKDHWWARNFGRKKLIVFVRRPDVRPATSTDGNTDDGGPEKETEDQTSAQAPNAAAPDPAGPGPTLLPEVTRPTSP